MTVRGITRVVEVQGRTFVLRELLVAELREWLSAVEQARFDLLGDGLLETPLTLLAKMAAVEAVELESLLPSELDELERAAKECNPRFFALIGRLQRANLPLPSATSTG